MFIVQKKENLTYSIPTKELMLKQLKATGSDLASSILDKLAEKPAYPLQLAKELKVHEQKIYYHIKNLREAGIITIKKTISKQGASTNYYGLAEQSFFIKFGEFKATQKLLELKKQHKEFLEPFVKDGCLNALIIVGSPDPHGPEKARSRDGYYGMDFALFLGTFLNYVPHYNVKLDTEVREEDLASNNIILIGGPVVNKVTEKINNKLPIFFDKNNSWSITSTLSKQDYPSDETGLIVKTKSPFNKQKCVLIIGGKRAAGTRAAIIAFLHGFKKITAGNIHNAAQFAKVVEGVDLDSDGIVDSVEFRE
ncbi:S-layer protein [Candidatus Woesearchaeota archaeon]|nr:S-layer protein [Candidatus Woesearchaeota archaeon]